MGRSLPLDPTASPAHAFAHELRQLRTNAGRVVPRSFSDVTGPAEQDR